MKNKFLTKILLTYTIIMFCIISIIFIGYYVNLKKDMDKRIHEYETEAFLSYINNCEEILNTMSYIAANVRTLKSLDMFVYSSKDDYYVKLTQLYNELSNLNNMLAEKGCQVVVHKSNDTLSISNISTAPLTYILNEYKIGIDTYSTIVTSLPETPLYSGHYIFTDRNIIYVTSKEYINDRALILVIANIKKFNSMQQQFMNASFALEGDNVTDLRQDIPQIPFSFKDFHMIALDDIITQKYGSVIYNFVKSKFPGIYYYYCTDNSILDKQMFITMLNTSLIFLGTFILAFLVISFFSIRLYRPIGRLIDIFMTFDSDGNSSIHTKNEIDYIAQQVQKIRSSNQELIKKLENSQRYLKTKLIYDALMGNYDSTTIQTELNKASLDWLNDECFVVIFELSCSGSNDNKEMLRNDSSLLENVVKVIYEQIKPNFRCEYIQVGRALAYFIIECNNIFVLKEKLTQITTLIETAFGLLISAFIGSISNSIAELKTSFSTANWLLENRNFIPIKNIYDYRDVKDLPSNQIIYPINIEYEIITAVEKNNIEEVKRLLNYIFEQYVYKAFENNIYRRLVVFALANTIERAVQKAGIEACMLAEGGGILYIELEKFEDVHSLKQYVIDIFERIFIDMEEISKLKFDKLKKDLADYIDKNMKNNITLLDISESFNFTPNYMSYLFKKVMGDNFKNYLSRKQIEKACELLSKNPTIKLSDLGEQIGINNVNTLIRLFKKYTGTTPGQFIKDNKIV